MPIQVPQYVNPQANVTDPYYGNYSALAQQFLRNKNHPVYSAGQGIADVLGDVGEAYFDKRARDKAQAQQSADNAKIAQAIMQASQPMTVAGAQSMQAGNMQGSFPVAQPAFPGGQAPQVPSLNGDPKAAFTPAQPAFDNTQATAEQKAIAALSGADPRLRLQALPAVSQVAQASIPKVNWQNTGAAMMPFDQNGRPMEGPNAPKPIPVGPNAYQQQELSLQQTNAAEAQRHNRAVEGNAAWIDTKDAMGNPVSYNRETGEVKTPKGVAADSEETMGPMAKGIANYDLPPLSSIAMLKPYGQNVMARVMKENPDYDAKFYASAKSAKQAFASGKDGNLLRMANTATSHLQALEQFGNALDSGDVKAVNAAKNFLKEQFGDADIASYDTAAKLVGDEVAKFIAGGQSGVADREAYSKQFSAARAPQQKAAAIGAARTLLVGQLRSLQRKYEAETRSKDFRSKLEPEVAALLDDPSVQVGAGAQTSAAPPASGGPAAGPSPQDIVNELRKRGVVK